ncbi:MAG: DUF2306 domain-containing protein [Flavobacteriales bacterium]
MKWLEFLVYAILVFFAALMLQITMQYVPVSRDAAFLGIKATAVSYSYYLPVFYIHVYTSMFALLGGMFQFSPLLRREFPQWHRSAGKMYIVVILLLSGPSGFIMSIHANGGWSSQIAFILLSVLWWWFTYKAYVSVRRRDFEAHRRFMIRSYALTLSAISLRLFKMWMTEIWHPNPMDAYKTVAWLGWTLNLLVAECIIRFRLPLKHQTSKHQ